MQDGPDSRSRQKKAKVAKKAAAGGSQKKDHRNKTSKATEKVAEAITQAKKARKAKEPHTEITPDKLKKDWKNVHSRTYHQAFAASLKAGKAKDDAKEDARAAAANAKVLFFKKKR